MALALGVNSFVELSDFTAWIADRIDMAESTAADDTTKSGALVSATDILNEMPWVSSVVDNEQPLAFPRVGNYFDPRIGGLVSLGGIPARIKQATMELANHLIINDGLQDTTGSVTDLQVGAIHLTKIQNAPVVPLKIRNIVRSLLVNQGSTGWWRNN